MIDNMYFEDYDGQETDGFTHIGVVGMTPIPIEDPDEQVKEFIRLYGNKQVRIYKPVEEEVYANR